MSQFEITAASFAGRTERDAEIIGIFGTFYAAPKPFIYIGTNRVAAP